MAGYKTPTRFIELQNFGPFPPLGVNRRYLGQRQLSGAYRFDDLLETSVGNRSADTFCALLAQPEITLAL